MSLRGDLDKKTDFDTLKSNYTAIAGSPETVLGMLEEAHDMLGFEHIVMYVHLGALSDELTRNNIRRIATDIIPKLRDHKSKRDM